MTSNWRGFRVAAVRIGSQMKLVRTIDGSPDLSDLAGTQRAQCTPTMDV